MASVDVGSVRAERSHLEFRTFLKDDDDSKLCADGNRPGKEPLDILRMRARGDVNVVSPLPEQHVPHAAACKKRLMAGLAHAFDDPRGGSFHPFAISKPPRHGGHHRDLRGTGETRQHLSAGHRQVPEIVLQHGQARL